MAKIHIRKLNRNIDETLSTVINENTDLSLITEKPVKISKISIRKIPKGKFIQSKGAWRKVISNRYEDPIAFRLCDEKAWKNYKGLKSFAVKVIEYIYKNDLVAYRQIKDVISNVKTFDLVYKEDFDYSLNYNYNGKARFYQISTGDYFRVHSNKISVYSNCLKVLSISKQLSIKGLVRIEFKYRNGDIIVLED